MQNLLRTKTTAIWLLLITATALSWAIGSGHGFGGDGRTAASLTILLVAVLKMRLVGRYFMELRDAPLALLALFEGYCVLVLGVTAGMYLLA
ncbi:cytochrome C oxidase subunit IV family protein [Nocardia miyunensis]|uniref:cytochrome C oxidase subunit IV family protein n=1 Tax=Nocardia miyunensis TaxID=282684 RepID=UPI00083066FF|nr:cytochrome C oxidase subunit IV family protein [Nocardia miyunensis]